MSEGRRPAEARGPDGPVRRIGILTTDDELVVTSWDARAGVDDRHRARPRRSAGRSPTSSPISRRAGCCASFSEHAGHRRAERCSRRRFHKYLIPAPPSAPSARYDRMQQRVGAGAADRRRPRSVGLVVTIEDVTERLELEHQLAGELRDANAAARLRAIERLAALDPVEGLGPLPAAMADEDWQVRRSAVRRAGRPARSGAGRRAGVGAARRAPQFQRAEQRAAAADDDRRRSDRVADRSAAASGRRPPDPGGARARHAAAAARRSTRCSPRSTTRTSTSASTRSKRSASWRRPRRSNGWPRSPSRTISSWPFRRSTRCRGSTTPRSRRGCCRCSRDELVGDQAAEALGQIGDEDAVAPLVAALDRAARRRRRASSTR